MLCPPSKNIETYHIPNSVKIIGGHAFYESKHLMDISIPYGVEEIGERAFYKCESFDSIVFPNTVTYIGLEAFRDCCNLRKATFLGKQPAVLDKYAFCGVDKQFIIVYNLAYEESWKNYDIHPTATFGEKITEPIISAEQTSVKINQGQIKKIYAKKKSSDKLKISLKKVKGAKKYQITIYKTKKNAKIVMNPLVTRYVKKRIATIKSKKLKTKRTYMLEFGLMH